MSDIPDSEKGKTFGSLVRIHEAKALLGLCGDVSLIRIEVPCLTVNKYRAFRGIPAGIAFRPVASPWFSQIFPSKPLVFNGLRDVASFHPAENPPVNPEAPGKCCQ